MYECYLQLVKCTILEFCINVYISDSSTDDRYKVSQKGPHDPYSLTITSLSKADLGVYYCCLPSGCSKNVNEDQCQSFEIDKKGKYL